MARARINRGTSLEKKKKRDRGKRRPFKRREESKVTENNLQANGTESFGDLVVENRRSHGSSFFPRLKLILERD